MAVDTRQKRFSMLSFGDGVIDHVLFEADGAVDADDRAHLLGLYSGIAISEPTVADGLTFSYEKLSAPGLSYEAAVGAGISHEQVAP